MLRAVCLLVLILGVPLSGPEADKGPARGQVVRGPSPGRDIVSPAWAAAAVPAGYVGQTDGQFPAPCVSDPT